MTRRGVRRDEIVEVSRALEPGQEVEGAFQAIAMFAWTGRSRQPSESHQGHKRLPERRKVG
jgi:hypothetical protein